MIEVSLIVTSSRPFELADLASSYQPHSLLARCFALVQ
jgi:hypothetical protein